MNYTAVDLFCGAGGFSAGLEAAGICVVGAADSWDRAVEAYRSHLSHPVVQANLDGMSAHTLRQLLDIGDEPVDLVVGGPPCQGFSIQRIGPDKDERNNLVLEFGRLVIEFRPKLFLMENVIGLLGKRGRLLADRFKSELLQAGYVVRAVRVNMAEYGVPQRRKRVIFYGWPIDASPFSFPAPTHTEADFVTVSDALEGLSQPPSNFTPHPTDPLHRRMWMSEKNIERLRRIPPGGGFEDLPVEMRVNCHKNGADRIGHRSVYGRLDPAKPAGTITARFDSFTRGRFAHPFEDRNITLREGARLQSFSDDFTPQGTQEEVAALIGNAVPPRFAEVVGQAVVRHFSGDGPRPKIAPEVSDSQLSLFTHT